jgi:type VI secretion system protein ImpC
MPQVQIDVDPSTEAFSSRATETQPARIKPDSDTPFRIAILGDFSGRAGKQNPGPVRAFEVDPGNLDAVMARMGVALELAVGDARLALEFRELLDFHPDSIYRSSPKLVGIPGKKVDPFQKQSTAAAAMRAILSHPDFQSLESAWRSIFFLFQHIEPSVDLRVHLIDAPRAEIGSGLRTLAIDRSHDQPWSVIAGLYTFSHSESDCALLAKIGTTAKQLGAPFIAGMSLKLFGCESVSATPDPDHWKGVSAEELTAWNALRRSPDAAWLGLAMPRFLLRAPYGAKTSPIQSFDFEEMPGAPVHDSYLWANPSIACATLLGKAFNADGWELRPGSINRIHSIPVHSYASGESTPPTEFWISERFAMTMIDAGVMPLASVKDSDTIQLVRMQSITDPPRPLAGPW